MRMDTVGRVLATVLPFMVIGLLSILLCRWQQRILTPSPERPKPLSRARARRPFLLRSFFSP